MCECMSETLDKVKAHLQEKLPKHEDFSAHWNGAVFRLDRPGTCVPLQVAYSYTRVKKNGDLEARRRKDTISIFPNYCLFCGTKLEKDDG